MDLTEQAEQAASRVLADAGMTTTDETTMRLLKMAWYAGYKTGMFTTKALADEAFAKLEASLA